jgi:hypothetical protein
LEQTLNLSFLYTKSDIERAMRLHYASRMRPRLDVFMALALAVAGAYLLHSPDSYWFGIFAVCASSALVLMLLAAFVILPTLAFRLEPKYRDDYSLTFSPEGIQFRTVHIDSQLQWNLYSRALVDGHSYLLYYGSRTFSIIPKRVLQDSQQRQAFEDLLGQRIPKIITKK